MAEKVEVGTQEQDDFLLDAERTVIQRGVKVKAMSAAGFEKLLGLERS